jgi:hypothetical protein
VQFVGITAFHTQIADPLIGGTYMTVSFDFCCSQSAVFTDLVVRVQLLNTVSNLGGTWPKVTVIYYRPVPSLTAISFPGIRSERNRFLQPIFMSYT